MLPCVFVCLSDKLSIDQSIVPDQYGIITVSVHPSIQENYLKLHLRSYTSTADMLTDINSDVDADVDLFF